jgi:hypothetical protein
VILRDIIKNKQDVVQSARFINITLGLYMSMYVKLRNNKVVCGCDIKDTL